MALPSVKNSSRPSRKRVMMIGSSQYFFLFDKAPHFLYYRKFSHDVPLLILLCDVVPCVGFNVV